MMTPEVMDSVAGALITRQILQEIVRHSVKTEFDRHYVVTMHKGVSQDLPRMSFTNLAKLLSCPKSAIHADIAEHMINGSKMGGCKVCHRASEGLKMQIVAEEDGRGGHERLVGLITVDSLKLSGRLTPNALAPEWPQASGRRSGRPPRDR